ncbi:hypothetical protein [Catenovulum maritimum]|uniref:Adenine nucleotide alpha hydrolase n=1 Tax=Catenovulum maritimum TaxID=1513271 RepID=A0A0J8GSS4_9ALTE|nr:hypothetical protein [Catenovulum maritimum]KMT63753.1 hypothetical protein XM47_17970 [Catenovulum maritimum]
MNIQAKLNRLIGILKRYPKLTIAVSGGVDSMLLSYVANQIETLQVTVAHAWSYAVPKQAYDRVLLYAKQYDWDLRLLDAGELADPKYVKNPVDRCYFCKSNLYQRIGSETQGVIASGTNLDDLSDFRPGLAAAKENLVVHPYVEADISKADIYKIANLLNLKDLETLPAQPCLASRVETGIQIDANDLIFIDLVESDAKAALRNITDVRCRITHQGVYLELSQIPSEHVQAQLSAKLARLCQAHQKFFSGIRLYQKGAAFIKDTPYYAAV